MSVILVIGSLMANQAIIGEGNVLHRKNRNNGSGGTTEFWTLWREKDGLGRGLSKYSLMCAFVMKCVRIGVMKKCGSHPKEREGEGVSIQTPTLLVCRERFEACGKKRRGGGRSPNDAGEPRGGTERLKCLLQLILGPVCRHFPPKSAHPEILANNGRRAQLPLLPVCEQLLTLKLKMNRLRAC